MHQQRCRTQVALHDGGHARHALVEQSADRRVEVEVLGVRLALRIESSQREQVEHQHAHALGLAAHGLQCGVERGGFTACASAQHVDVALERGQRCAQLV